MTSMKKVLFCAILVVVTACGGGSSNASADEGKDSTAVEQNSNRESLLEEEPTEIEGTIADEMMSSVTVVTDEGDTIVLLKGENFTSDAVIGDKVKIEIDYPEDEPVAEKIEKK